jgi:hypothetical protein
MCCSAVHDDQVLWCSPCLVCTFCKLIALHCGIIPDRRLSMTILLTIGNRLDACSACVCNHLSMTLVKTHHHILRQSFSCCSRAYS